MNLVLDHDVINTMTTLLVEGYEILETLYIYNHKIDELMFYNK